MIQKIIAFILAVVLSPIIAIIIIIILIDDGFPIIYVQKNYGLNHKPFDLYKFRTMKNDTPEVPTEHFTENHSASFLLSTCPNPPATDACCSFLWPNKTQAVGLS